MHEILNFIIAMRGGEGKEWEGKGRVAYFQGTCRGRENEGRERREEVCAWKFFTNISPWSPELAFRLPLEIFA